MSIVKTFNEIKTGALTSIKIQNARIVKGLFIEIAKLMQNYSKETVGAVIKSQIEFSLQQKDENLQGFAFTSTMNTTKAKKQISNFINKPYPQYDSEVASPFVAKITIKAAIKSKQSKKFADVKLNLFVNQLDLLLNQLNNYFKPKISQRLEILPIQITELSTEEKEKRYKALKLYKEKK